MNFKLKSLVAAVALVSAAQANAAIGTNELFLNAYDTVAGVTYVKDLGILGSAASTMTSWDLTSDANFASFQAQVNAANVIWNVVAVGDPVANGAPVGGQIAAYSTASTNLTLAGLNTANQKLKAFDSSVTPYVNLTTANGSSVHVKSGATDAADFGFGFQTNWAGQAGFNSTAANGASMNLYSLAFNGTGNLTKITQAIVSPAVITFNEAAGTLVSVAAVAPIPEPSEYALLVAGLLMMGAIARRRAA